MKKITISFLVLFLLFGSFTLEFPSVEASNKTHVKEKQALNYAKKFLKENVVTKNDISVTFKANIYDIDDSILGYYFSYIEEGGDNGYIIISASKERTPIIEFGEGDLGYDFSKELDSGNRIYYLGALSYLFAQNKEGLLIEFDKIKNKEIKLLEDALKDQNEKLAKEEKDVIRESIDNIKKEKLKSMDKGIYDDKWSILEQSDLALTLPFLNPTSAHAETIYESKTLSVSRIWQRMSGVSHPDSSCGPTSGAMVAKYLNSRGYSVKYGYHYGGDAKFINYLWGEMSWYWGASMGAYRSNMEDHLNLNYSGHKFDIVEWDTDSFTTYKNFIKEGFPVTIRFNNLTRGDYWSDWHFVVGNAYKVSNLGNFVGVKDPDGGQYNTGTKYFAWSPNYKVISLAKIDKNY